MASEVLPGAPPAVASQTDVDADVEDAIAAGNDPNAIKFLGWTSTQGEECGDFPVADANPLTQVFREVPLNMRAKIVGTTPESMLAF